MSKPRIGIALGSGVARGWAHIGVLKALSRAGIELDIISGTSIGALVGGCHLADRLDPLEEFARSLTRRRLISLLDFRFRSSGLIGDAKLEALLNAQLGDMQVTDLKGTLIAVATELATGHEVWLREGNLVQLLRASYALPGVFAPVMVDGRWLIDGALVNPVPVSAARALGARMVIAVNLNTDPFDPAARRHWAKGKMPAFYVPFSAPAADALKQDIDELVAEGEEALLEAKGDPAAIDKGLLSGIRKTLKRVTNLRDAPEREVIKRAIGTPQRGPGFATVLLAALNIVQDRLARARLAGDPPDIVIAPRIGHLGLLEFDRADELIRCGEEAVDELLPQIRETMELLQ
jgi:NTE family protein